MLTIQKQIDSLAAVVLQNRWGLDFLTAKEGVFACSSKKNAVSTSTSLRHGAASTYIRLLGQVLGFQEMIRLLLLLVSGTYKVLLCLRGLYPCKVGWAPGLSLVKGKMKSRPMGF